MPTDMFLKISGPEISGESRDRNHKDEIDVLAWSWGVSQSATTHVRGGNSQGSVSVQDISMTKYIDQATPLLLLACCQGTRFETATLVLRKEGAFPLEYLTITMEDLIISSVSSGGSSGEGRQTEHISLNFARVRVSYQEQDERGRKEGVPVKMGWDIAQNKDI